MKRLYLFNNKYVRKLSYYIPLFFVLVFLFFMFVMKDKDIKKVKKPVTQYQIQLYTDKALTHKVQLPFYGDNTDKIYDFYFRVPLVKDDNIVHVISRHNILTADLDGINFYASDIPSFNGRRTYVGRVQSFIPLNSSCSGKIMTVHMSFQKNIYKKGISSVQVTTLSSYISAGLKQCVPPCIMAIILFISSIITFYSLIFSFLITKKRRKKEVSVFLNDFLISLCMVLWIFTSFDVIGVIIGNNVSFVLLNYLAFTVMPIIFSSFLMGIYDDEKKYLKILRSLGIANLAGQTILFIAGIFDFTQMLFVTHIITFANVFSTLAVVIDFKYVKESTREQKVMCFGSALFSICCIIGILMYIFNSAQSFMLSISIGISVFFVLHMYTSIMRLLDSVKEHEELLECEKDLYKDQLTTLGNRRQYFKRLSVIREKGIDPNLNFIMLDVNGLKILNDTLGHEAGDELLKGTAVCMQESFPDAEILCRLGGDEFVLVVKEKTAVLKKRLERFLAYARNYNGIVIKSISIAYGIANLEKYPGRSASELLRLADEEMYKNKSEYYQKKHSSSLD